MWKVKTAEIEPLLRGTHDLVTEMLTWAVTETDPTKHILTLQARAKRANGRLGDLARKTDLFKFMARLAKSGHASDIKADYVRITNDYRAFLDGGAQVQLSDDAQKTANHCFRWLYSDLLNEPDFWSLYATHMASPLSLKLFREKAGAVWTVCPYCDHNKVHIPEAGQTDHFLAQAYFPVLTVYWANLVLSCHTCNMSIKKASFIGTRNGKAKRVPIFHPYFHEAAAHVHFGFAANWTPTGPHIRGTSPTDRERSKHYLKLFRHLGALYAGQQKFVENQINQFLAIVKSEYYRLGPELGWGRPLLTRILKRQARIQKRGQWASRGASERSKLMFDLYAYLAGQANLVASRLKIRI